MTSILDQHANDRHAYHTCGGTILSGPDHVYCDRCGAVAYYDEDEGETRDDAMEEIQSLGAGESNL